MSFFPVLLNLFTQSIYISDRWELNPHLQLGRQSRGLLWIRYHFYLLDS